MPEIDLEPHEYQRRQRERRQPVFLPGGKAALAYVLGLVALGVVLTFFASPIISGITGLARRVVEGG